MYEWSENCPKKYLCVNIYTRMLIKVISVVKCDIANSRRKLYWENYIEECCRFDNPWPDKNPDPFRYCRPDLVSTSYSVGHNNKDIYVYIYSIFSIKHKKKIFELRFFFVFEIWKSLKFKLVNVELISSVFNFFRQLLFLINSCS